MHENNRATIHIKKTCPKSFLKLLCLREARMHFLSFTILQDIYKIYYSWVSNNRTLTNELDLKKKTVKLNGQNKLEQFDEKNCQIEWVKTNLNILTKKLSN